MKDISYVFGNLFSVEEFEKLKAASSADEANDPVRYLLVEDFESSGPAVFTRENTRKAVSSIARKHGNWLNKKKRELLKEKDHTGLSSSFAEIRSFGLLIDLFGDDDVQPYGEIKNVKTPDFKIDLNGIEIDIETASIQMNKKEAESLEKFNKDWKAKVPGKDGIAISEHFVTPFGNKKGVSSLQSAILKMIDVKSENNQLVYGNPSVLWVDVQSEHMSLAAYHVVDGSPLRIVHWGDGEILVQSNILWYSVYARQNEPVFEGRETLINFPPLKWEIIGYLGHSGPWPFNLVHEGKFMEERYKNLSAVIYSAPDRIIIFENPYAENKLPDSFMKRLLAYDGLNKTDSRMDYPNRDLLGQIEKDRKLIEDYASIPIISLDDPSDI